MKKYALIVASALIMLVPAVSNADYVPMKTKSPAAVQSVDLKQGFQYFNTAYEAYYNAKNSSDNLFAAENYVKAIANVSQASTIEPDNVSYIALSMQIYRGKGVLPYAKSAVLKAEKILQSKLQAEPNDVATLLDYAILCYAGDMAYRPEAAHYKQKATQMAQKIINLTDDTDDIKALRARAYAYLLLGQEAEFKDTMRIEPGFFSKLFGNNSTNEFYLDLYEKTVAKGQWLWPVADKYLVNEYLLYYLCDISR